MMAAKPISTIDRRLGGVESDGLSIRSSLRSADTVRRSIAAMTRGGYRDCRSCTAMGGRPLSSRSKASALLGEHFPKLVTTFLRSPTSSPREREGALVGSAFHLTRVPETTQSFPSEAIGRLESLTYIP